MRAWNLALNGLNKVLLDPTEISFEQLATQATMLNAAYQERRDGQIKHSDSMNPWCENYFPRLLAAYCYWRAAQLAEPKNKSKYYAEVQHYLNVDPTKAEYVRNPVVRAMYVDSVVSSSVAITDLPGLIRSLIELNKSPVKSQFNGVPERLVDEIVATKTAVITHIKERLQLAPRIRFEQPHQLIAEDIGQRLYLDGVVEDCPIPVDLEVYDIKSAKVLGTRKAVDGKFHIALEGIGEGMVGEIGVRWSTQDKSIEELTGTKTAGDYVPQDPSEKITYQYAKRPLLYAGTQFVTDGIFIRNWSISVQNAKQNDEVTVAVGTPENVKFKTQAGALQDGQFVVKVPDDTIRITPNSTTNLYVSLNRTGMDPIKASPIPATSDTTPRMTAHVYQATKTASVAVIRISDFAKVADVTVDGIKLPFAALDEKPNADGRTEYAFLAPLINVSGRTGKGHIEVVAHMQPTVDNKPGKTAQLDVPVTSDPFADKALLAKMPQGDPMRLLCEADLQHTPDDPATKGYAALLDQPARQTEAKLYLNDIFTYQIREYPGISTKPEIEAFGNLAAKLGRADDLAGLDELPATIQTAQAIKSDDGIAYIKVQLAGLSPKAEVKRFVMGDITFDQTSNPKELDQLAKGQAVNFLVGLEGTAVPSVNVVVSDINRNISVIKPLAKPIEVMPDKFDASKLPKDLADDYARITELVETPKTLPNDMSPSIKSIILRRMEKHAESLQDMANKLDTLKADTAKSLLSADDALENYGKAMASASHPAAQNYIAKAGELRSAIKTRLTPIQEGATQFKADASGKFTGSITIKTPADVTFASDAPGVQISATPPDASGSRTVTLSGQAPTGNKVKLTAQIAILPELNRDFTVAIAEAPKPLQFDADIEGTVANAAVQNGKNAAAISIPYTATAGTSEVAWSLEKKITASKEDADAKVIDVDSWIPYPASSSPSKPDAQGKGTIEIPAQSLVYGEYRVKVALKREGDASPVSGMVNGTVNVYGRNVAMVVGIDYYTSTKGLNHACDDARNMRVELLKLGYNPRNIVCLLGTKNASETEYYRIDNIKNIDGRLTATAGEVDKEALTSTENRLYDLIKTQKPSHILIYYSGHGTTKVTADSDTKDCVYTSDGGSQAITEMMNSIDKVIPEEKNQAKVEVVGIFDACRPKANAKPSLVGTFKPSVQTSSFLFPIYACSPNQFSTENPTDDRGLVVPPDGKFDDGFFTYSLLKSLEANYKENKDLTMDNVLRTATVNLNELVDLGKKKAPDQYSDQNIYAGEKLEKESDVEEKILKQYRQMHLANPG